MPSLLLAGKSNIEICTYLNDFKKKVLKNIWSQQHNASTLMNAHNPDGFRRSALYGVNAALVFTSKYDLVMKPLIYFFFFSSWWDLAFGNLLIATEVLHVSYWVSVKSEETCLQKKQWQFFSFTVAKCFTNSCSSMFGFTLKHFPVSLMTVVQVGETSSSDPRPESSVGKTLTHSQSVKKKKESAAFARWATPMPNHRCLL